MAVPGTSGATKTYVSTGAAGTATAYGAAAAPSGTRAPSVSLRSMPSALLGLPHRKRSMVGVRVEIRRCVDDANPGWVGSRWQAHVAQHLGKPQVRAHIVKRRIDLEP